MRKDIVFLGLIVMFMGFVVPVAWASYIGTIYASPYWFGEGMIRLFVFVGIPIAFVGLLITLFGYWREKKEKSEV